MVITYDALKSKAVRIGQRAARKMKVDSKNARPGELLLFARLETNKSEYKLSLAHEDASRVLDIAKGLRDRNGFAAIGMALGVLPAPVINSNEHADAAEIIYHADTNVFIAAATVDLTEAQAIACIYNGGRHTLKTNQEVRIDDEPNVGFRTVHQTQASATTANQFNGSEVKPFGAIVRFGGGDINEVIITLNCDDKSAISGVTGTRNNYLAVRLIGSIIHGATTKMYTNR